MEIELRERPTVEQLRALSTGVVDVALVRPPIQSDIDLHLQEVMREHTIAAIPEDHELAAMRRIPLKRLAAEPLVLFPRSQAPGYHDQLIVRLAATGTTPHIVQYAPEMMTIIGLVAAGIGVSPVPASLEHLAIDGVTYRPLSGAPDAELVALTRAGETSPLAEAFVDTARAVA